MSSAGADVDSLPTLPAHVHNPVKASAVPPVGSIDQDDGKGGLIRSASFTYIPGAQAGGSEGGIKRTFSENVLSLSSDTSARANGSAHNANKHIFRRASRKVKKKLSTPRVTVSSDDLTLNGAAHAFTTQTLDLADRPKTPSRSVADTLRSLTRTQWIPSSSRSPSPSASKLRKADLGRGRSPGRRASALTAPEPITPPLPVVSSKVSPRSSRLMEDELPPAPDFSHPVRSTTPQPRNVVRPLSEISRTTKSETSLHMISRTSSSLSLHSTASSDNLRMLMMKVPPIPSSMSSDRLSAASTDMNRRKDPLWGAFRSLEGDFQKFQSKTSTHKANVIRTCLLPFLLRYTDHPSIKALRVEDLDRRVVILNKWWIALLEMLNGRNNQSISGIDRPVFLEGLTGIMTRAEWRIPPFPSASPTDTPHSMRPSIPKSRSTASFESNGSDALSDSIHQNVRNMFIQNLLSQMAFVVDRMSMRTAPASLVSFCGKACAYAFFFCPGVADILVRLWRIPPDSVRRIFAEAGVPRGAHLAMIAKQIASHFPPPLRGLSVVSQVALTRYLGRKFPLPLGAAYIRWYGPWVNRWTGRDSDLFFVFTKHFHSLVAECLPSGSCMDPKERACVPGLIPVHAQILTILENTIYRQAQQAQAESFASSTTDDGGNLDTSASLPMTLANAARSMAENRLIMLLRDVLADKNPDHSTLRELYAGSFNGIMKAAARKISIYNNDACFALCDFVEEVWNIMGRYHQTYPETPNFDWPFWLRVYKMMMTSHNSLTEIRLITFLYSNWNILISNEDRRRELCLGWLLEPVFFAKHFNHWSPMVRHYFLRLLCWRVARYDGDASSLDIEIHEALADRLNTSWAQYVYLRAEAEMREKALPSSAPCSPAPARRLIIIRTDSQPLHTNILASFDKLLSPSPRDQTTPYTYRRHSTILNNIPPVDSPPQNKKRWSILKSLLGTPGNSRPGEVTPPASADDSTMSLDNVNIEGLPIRNKTTSPKSRPTTPPHQSFSFKFSLEWLERPTWPSKNKKLSAPALPAPAQVLLQIHQGVRPEVKPEKPKGEDLGTAKYAGRALAEWALIVTECQNFFERRKEEGVPTNRLVETPTLGVESFRMYGSG